MSTVSGAQQLEFFRGSLFVSSQAAGSGRFTNQTFKSLIIDAYLISGGLLSLCEAKGLWDYGIQQAPVTTKSKLSYTRT